MARRTAYDDEYGFDEEVNNQTRSALGIVASPEEDDFIDPVPREDLPPYEEPVIDSGIGTKYWEPTPGAEGGVESGEPSVSASALAPTPVGWDPAKWATEQTPKYIIGRILSKYPPTASGVQQAMAEIRQYYPGASFDDIDKLSGLGQWEGRDLGAIDVIANAGSPQSSYAWLPDVEAPGGALFGSPASTATGLAATGVTTAGVPAATTATTAGTEAGAGGDAFSDEIRQQILALLAGSNEPITAESANLAPAAKAFRLAQERSAQTQREKLAERMAAQGLGDSGALDAGIGGIYQQQGQDVASFEGQLVLNELTSRRAEVQQALQLGAGLVTADQESALRRELAALDAQIRREGISVQERLGISELELRRLIAEMQNQQFNDQLGFNIGDREAYWNAYGLGS